MSTSRSLANKAFVVWPPVWNAFDPHVAVPALCGYLAGRGVPLRQFDLNIDFFRYLVAENTIEQQLRRTSAPLPWAIENAAHFVRSYFDVLRQPMPAGYRQRFSEDAEQLLLFRSIEIFNHLNPDTIFSTLGVYQTGNAENSDFLADFAARNSGNPFAGFYQEQFLPALQSDLPKVVGISICGSFQLAAALTLARMIKEIDPRIYVVAGGAFFSTIPQCLQAPRTSDNLFRHIDVFVLNEGEMPFLRILEDVFFGRPPQPGPNILLRGQQELCNEPRYCLPPAQIAPPVFAEGAISKYFRPVRRIPVEVSRGCYWAKCTFCNLARGSNERYRGVPLHNIVQYIETLAERYGTSSVLFSTLAMAPKILQGIASHMRAAGGKIAWNAWIRAENTLTRDDFVHCRQSGCSSLSVTRNRSMIEPWRE